MNSSTVLPPKLDAASIAADFGKQLVDSAIWDNAGETCNWLGYRDILDKEIAAYSKRLVALSPEVYSGSAGVAWFLAELSQVFGNEKFRKTALAAWKRSAKYQLAKGSPAPGISFFSGDLGIAFVGFRIRELFGDGDKDIVVLSEELLAQVGVGLEVHHGWDVIGGNAGAIPPLKYLAQRHDRMECMELAIRCADELLEEAEWKGRQCMWSFEKVVGVEMDSPPMSGFSHGANGIAVGLLEMYAATGNAAYRQAAEGAFLFEEELFDRRKGNWVDTRYPYQRDENGIEGVFKNAWCHGAPGICLGHLKAAELNPEWEAFHLERAGIAVNTTLKRMQELLKVRGTDTSWCHGLGGLSEIALIYAEKTGNEKVRQSCIKAMQKMADWNYLPGQWPSGLVYGGTSPSLLIGYSGTAWHYLRAAFPGRIPSVLLFEVP